MAVAVGSGQGTKSDINITPLIDVLLVLLVIFMVITPITPRGLAALIPQPNREASTQRNIIDGRTVVVRVLHRVSPARSALKINQP